MDPMIDADADRFARRIMAMSRAGTLNESDLSRDCRQYAKGVWNTANQRALAVVSHAANQIQMQGGGR